MSDELKLSPLPPPPADGPDSFTDGLAKAARSRKGQRLLAKLWPFALATVSAVAAWVGSKADSKAELQAAITLTAEVIKLRDEDKKERTAQHEKLLTEIALLRGDVLSDSLRQPGKVTKLERAQYAVWRALAELRAAALTAETSRARSAKELQITKFGRAFDNRTRDGQDPVVAHDTLFAQVAIP